MTDALKQKLVQATQQWISDCGLDVRDTEAFVSNSLAPIVDQELAEREKENISSFPVMAVILNKYANGCAEVGKKDLENLPPRTTILAYDAPESGAIMFKVVTQSKTSKEDTTNE